MPKKDLTPAQKAAKTRREREASMSPAELREFEAKRKDAARKAAETRRKRRAGDDKTATDESAPGFQAELRAVIRDELRKIVRDEIQSLLANN